MVRILLIVSAVCLCVILNVSVSFCQCGPDGKQPCNSTPKKPVAKKPTVIHTPSRPVAKPVNHPPVRKPKTKPDDAPAESEKSPAASANGVKAHVPLKEAVRFKYLGDVDTRKPDGTTDFDAKIQNYEKAIEIDPKYADAYLDLGMVFESKGDIDTAIIKFGKAIENDRSLIRAYLHRGDAYYRKKEYESAISNFSQLLTLDPTNSYAYLNRGKARIGLNDREAAIDDFAKAILNDSSTTAQAVSSKAYLERADAYSFIKAYDDSIS